mmetsp:Transcript_33985/g.64692  ORF Transcript_33985/g.64692 Transcript_33985/m.64692 type:complete len:283 (+) Transcript_33985:111-959(+)
MAQRLSFRDGLSSITMKPSSQTLPSRNRRHSHQTKTYLYATITACSCFLLFSSAAAFSPPSSGILRSRTININSDISLQQNHVQTITTSTSTRLYNFDNDDDDNDGDDDFDYSGFDPSVADQIRKAKQLINDSKKKQKSQEEAAAKAAEEGTVEQDQGAVAASSSSSSSATTLPFFANQSLTASAAENARKIKSKTETGEIIADGDTMASLSKSEPWEVRSLNQMFEKEKYNDYDGNETYGDTGTLANRDVAGSIYNLRKKLQTEDFRKVFDSKNWLIGDLD